MTKKHSVKDIESFESPAEKLIRFSNDEKKKKIIDIIISALCAVTGVSLIATCGNEETNTLFQIALGLADCACCAFWLKESKKHSLRQKDYQNQLNNLNQEEMFESSL